MCLPADIHTRLDKAVPSTVSLLQRCAATARRVRFDVNGCVVSVDFKKLTEDDVLMQVRVNLCCNKTGLPGAQLGRQFAIQSSMSDDAIIRTIYMACKAFVLHELAETFLVDGEAIFEHSHN